MISTIEAQPAASGQNLVQQVAEIFSAKGILSRSKNFEFRPQQQAMAVAVATALESGEHLAVEAGTGVGKSLAYLVPAILYAVANKKKAVVSTHTINLQEQLTQKDLPMLEQILPVRFNFTMLKGRGNYLCTRRLQKAVQQAANLFTSSETEELKRIHEWSKTTTDGSLSDFDVEPDPKVWAQVCSERGLCSPKLCGHPSDFGQQHGICFFQRARNRILASDVLVLNHTLFFTLLGALEEEAEGGILFRNDFVIFDEAHQVEHVASRHIGLSVSSGQVRYALHRLWNPRTEKGLLATLRKGGAVKLVAELLKEADGFFGNAEVACEELQQAARKRSFGGGEAAAARRREWTEVRIRRPELVQDNVTLPIQRLREAVSELIKLSEDKEIGQELLECNRRLGELREEVGVFLNQSAENYVYWVERTGRAQRTLALNAAPVDVAEFLRRRLFGSDTSVVMTSATLSVSGELRGPRSAESDPHPAPRTPQKGPGARNDSGLSYFAHRVGAEAATLLQVGTPFDYERQMKLYVVGKMPDPRADGYRDALIHWIEHFVKLTHGKAFVLFTNFNLTHMSESSPMYRSRYWDGPVTPLFPFGFGLSYSSFSFTNLKVSAEQVKVGETIDVHVDVANTGPVAGDEVAQLYIHQRAGSDSRPARELKGFERLTLQPGESRTVTFKLGPDELTYWSASAGKWVQDAAAFDVWVGSDSQAALHAEFSVIE